MENPNQIASRVREVFFNGKWIANTNYMELLSNLNWKQATKEIDSLHSIAALTYHINYYLAGILNVFEGGSLDIRDKYSFDLPKIESEGDWENLKNNFWTNAEKIAGTIERLAGEKLDDLFVDEKYGTCRRNIEGMIEHGYYHLGQISLIKKMIQNSENKDT
jgi:uncharacterized damage-inducible protein DinB